tara:strand:- start:6771 stop:7022 length:252 start_codon:yes stop_codon:yes gene_type:complete
MNKIMIYTKDNCPYCTQAKAQLSIKNEDYTEMKIGADLTREEFGNIFPGVKTVPFIIINGEHVGGYDKLIEWYNRPGQSFLAE